MLDFIPKAEENCVLGGTESVAPSCPPSSQADHISPCLSNLSLALSLVCPDCFVIYSVLFSYLLPVSFFGQSRVSRCHPELTMEITTQDLSVSYLQTSLHPQTPFSFLGCPGPIPISAPRAFSYFACLAGSCCT